MGRREVSAETAALTAVLDGDMGRAHEILEDFFPSELSEFIDKVDLLKAAAETELIKKGAR